MRAATFVVLSVTDWDAPQFGSRQQVALRFARRGHRVLFVDVARSLHSLLTDRAAALRSFRPRAGRDREVEPRLHVFTPPPVLPHLWAPGVLAVNQALLLRAVRAALARLDWRADVLWTYWPNTTSLFGALDERVAVYHCVEDFPSIGYPLTPRRRMERIEAEQVRRADLVVVRNEKVAARHRPLNPSTHLIPGGVDLDLFDPDRIGPAADDVARLPAPRVGLVGTIDDRVDIELIAACARALPAVSFVLAGPLKRHRVDPRPLAGLPNVHRLAPRSHREVPATLGALDVCLIPYRVEDATVGLAPLKLYEALALGLPVVATDLPYVRREAGVVRLAGDAPSFVAAIEAALADAHDRHEVARRRAAAAPMGWEAQVDRLEALLEPLLDRGSGLPRIAS